MLVATAAVAATCFGALRASPLVADAFYTVCWATILLAAVAAIIAKDRRRAFCIGYLLFAAVYARATVPVNDAAYGFYFRQRVNEGFQEFGRPAVLPSRLLVYVYDVFLADAAPASLSSSDRIGFLAFLTTCNSAIAMLVGGLGGALAIRFHRRQTEKFAEPSH
jgi:hypothetical protein